MRATCQRGTGLLQVYASYRYRRDLADAAKISGVFGRSRILKREEAIKQKVSMLSQATLCTFPGIAESLCIGTAGGIA